MTEHAPIPRPCGNWPSPVSTDLITGDAVRLSSPGADRGQLYWIEGRPSEAGRSVLVRRAADGSVTDLTPQPYSVRSKVHEYGGAAYLAAAGRCWFVNARDQGIYETAPGEPRLLTSEAGCRYADLELDPLRERLLAICEHHGDGKEAANFLVDVDLATGERRTLVRGADFYSNPRLSPDGRQLAWLCWHHPQMPWDGTELWLADLDETGLPHNPRRVAGSDTESVFQPLWSPDGQLYYVSDADNWWNLYCWDGSDCRQVTREQAEMGLPQWVFGMSTWGLLDEHTAIASLRSPGAQRVVRVNLADGVCQVIAQPFTGIEHLAVQDRCLLALGGSPGQPMALAAAPAGEPTLQLIRHSVSSPLAPDWISQPRYLEFPSAGGSKARGFYYPPTNPGCRPMPGESPPLIIIAHGGPTGATSTIMDLRIQFWTSRGFAVFDVDYRGSTGYGRHYRRSLYGHWGVADVEDCVHGARHLCQQGLADPDRLIIRGSSAGGYLVLCAAAFHDQFRAGASYYGIGELQSLFEHTHKFESRYDRSLLGEGELSELFASRSPARHAEKINTPLIFFQGLDDKVVPPDQSENMYRILRDHGLPVAYLPFDGEGHGFRAAETIAVSLMSELAFYARILGLSPAEPLPTIPLANPPGDGK